MSRSIWRHAALAGVFLAGVLGNPAFAATPSPLLLGPGIDAGSLRVTTFATGLDFPNGIVALPDGSLLVAESAPEGGSYFSSTGRLTRLTDADRDGSADDAGTTLADGLPGTLVGLARAGNLVLATTAQSGDEGILVFRRGKRWRDPLRQVAEIRLDVTGFLHQSYGLAVRPHPGAAHRFDLLFNIGADGNDSGGGVAHASGLVTGDLADSSIHLVTIGDDASGLLATPPVQIARGLRNAAAFVFEPGSGDLVIADNGIDTPGNEIEALSADEIDRIPAAAIGGPVEDFGFPESYVRYRTGEVVGGRGVAPEFAFQPIGASENEGAASLAVAPAGFPAGMNDGLFVGFHGQSDDFGLDNEENPLVFVDPRTGTSVDLVSNDDPVVGHIGHLLATADTLYLVDLCGGGHLTEATPCGAIYRITGT